MKGWRDGGVEGWRGVGTIREVANHRRASSPVAPPS